MRQAEELTIRLVELKGSSYQIGLDQSKEFRSVKFSEKMAMLHAMTSGTDAQKAKELLENISPNIHQELNGFARGLEMDADTIVQLFSGYDIAFPDMGCTAFAQNGYYVRNYDFSPDMYDARFVFTKPTDGYCTVGFSQQIFGRLDGMNEKGLVVGLHFVNSKHRGKGFMATTIVRMLLEQCGSIEEALELLTTIPHGYCFNYSLTDPSGKSVIVEASPEHQVVYVTDPLICTNHFESERLLEKNRPEILGSVKRKEYVRSLLDKGMSPLSAYHRFNDSDSPLFFKHYKEYFGTLHTVVYSPKDLNIIVGVGENCKPMTFSLKEFIEGTLIIPEYMKGIIHQEM